MRLISLICLVLLALTSATHFNTVAKAVEPRRLALVVGNAQYKYTAQLANPINDAELISKALRKTGFEVISGFDLGYQAFISRIRTFSERLSKGDTALFFYAGHGLQVNGTNYLLPTDAKLKTERDIQFEAIPLELVMAQMESGSFERTNLVFLDACRDNPLARSLARTMGTRSVSVQRGLAREQTGIGTFIAFSTQPDNVAYDGVGRHSPFAAALNRHITIPDITISSLMNRVRRDVVKTTKGQQVPWDHSSLLGDFYFMRAGNASIRTSEVKGTQKPKTSVPTATQQTSGHSCVPMGRRLTSPIKVKRGTKFCSLDGRHNATITRVHPDAIVFSVDNVRTTCRPGELCRFNWPVAPLFTSRITRKPSLIGELVSAE